MTHYHRRTHTSAQYSARVTPPRGMNQSHFRAEHSEQSPKISIVWLMSENPFPRDVGGPCLGFGALDFDGRARIADTPDGDDAVASTVDKPTSVLRSERVDQARGGHGLQPAVDRGQSDAFASTAQFVVKFLSRAELLRFSSRSQTAAPCRVARVPGMLGGLQSAPAPITGPLQRG